MADRTSTVRVNVVTDASGAGSTLGKFGRVAGIAALGVGALGVGVAVGANKLATFADISDDANAKIANVVKTMKLFKGETEQVTQRIQDQAKALSLATAVDINSIKATQAKLLTFKELAKTADDMGGQFDRATQAAVDMAALGFGTAEQNAVQLGKALNDPIKGITALNKSGITFTETEKARIATLVESNRMGEAQALILKAIETQVKGTAEATAGGFELMKNKVSIFAEEVGLKLLPYLDRFGNFMIETGGPALMRFGKAVAENVVPALQRLGTFIGEKVIPVLVQLAGWVQEHIVPMFKTVLADALEGARGMFNNVAKAVRDNEGDLKDLWEGFKKVAEFIVDKVVPVMSNFMRTTLPLLGTAIGTAITVIADIIAKFKAMYDQINDVIGAITTLIQKLRDLAGARSEASGDSLDELNENDTSGRQAPSSRGGVTVNVNMPPGTFVGDEAALAREINRITGNDLRRILGPQAA